VFSSPCKRFEKILGQRESITFSRSAIRSGIYTIDDGQDFTATPLDPFSSDVVTLREQVLSLEETHVFFRLLW